MEVKLISTIKDWALEDRPREKFILMGKNAVTDAELIAILLGFGYKDVSAVELAKIILANADNDLHQLSKKTVKELMQLKGVGEAKAITIAASLELGRRRKEAERVRNPQIKSSSDIYKLYNHLFADLPYEEFRAVYLNQANRVICQELIGRGGVAGTVADPKIIFNYALAHLASAIVVMHNHPSGNSKPSNADLQLTSKIKSAATFFDMRLVDHLIFFDGGFTSFADEGLI